MLATIGSLRRRAQVAVGTATNLSGQRGVGTSPGNARALERSKNLGLWAGVTTLGLSGALNLGNGFWDEVLGEDPLEFRVGVVTATFTSVERVGCRFCVGLRRAGWLVGWLDCFGIVNGGQGEVV